MALFETQTRGVSDDVIGTHGPMVYRLAYSWVQNIADAEDITQEVFMRYLKRLPNFTDLEHSKAWFIKVTANCAKSFLASRWRAYEPLEDSAVDAILPDDTVLDAIGKLKPDERACIHLYYYEDLSVAEISRYLKMNASTVKSHLHRARAALKDLLKEDYDGL